MLCRRRCRRSRRGVLEPRRTLADLTGALGGPFAQPPLQHLQGRVDEDRDASGDEIADRERSRGLELEQAGAAFRRDALDLGVERPGAVGDERDVLGELARRDAAIELLVAEKVVVDAVDLARAAGPRGRRDGQLEVVTAGEGLTDERPLPRPRGTGDDEELGAACQRRRRPTSSARCRSDSPPTVFDWLMRHWLRKRAAFTRPNFGTAMRMSKTFAVSTYSGGWRRIFSICTLPAFRSFFNWARLTRISFARRRASIR